MAFLEIRNVEKAFGPIRVLRGVNLNVTEHQVVCLIGPSGCGKSTLLRCINWLEKIQGGEIRLEDDRVSGPGIDVDKLRQNVGIVFQSFNLFPHMSVIENVTLAPLKVLKFDRAEAEERAMALLKRIGLEAKAREYPDRLSGGQQQRVAIVRALAMEPKLLLLDEITSALDPELVSEVLNIVRDLAKQGMTMLLATHEMGFAREVASKICFLYDGVVHEAGPPQQLFGNPKRERTRAFLKRIIEGNHVRRRRNQQAGHAQGDVLTNDFMHKRLPYRSELSNSHSLTCADRAVAGTPAADCFLKSFSITANRRVSSNRPRLLASCV